VVTRTRKRPLAEAEEEEKACLPRTKRPAGPLEELEKRGLSSRPVVKRVSLEDELFLAREEARMRKISSRKKKWGEVPDAHQEEGILERGSVAPATREGYDNAIAVLLKRRNLAALPTEDKKLDAELVMHSDTLFLEGKGASTGQKLLAGVLYHRPQAQIPRMKRALKGWRRLAPGKTRQPLPESVVSWIALKLLAAFGMEYALCWMIMVDGYLRPGEAVYLLVQNVVPPSSGFPRASLVLFRQEEGRRGKTGDQDESLTIALQWLSDCLMALVRKRGKSGRIFQFSLAEMRNAFLCVCTDTTLATLQPALYMGRHSGASLDRHRGVPLAEVQKRGRWRSATSVRRYEKAPLLQRVLSALTEAEAATAKRAFVRLPMEMQKAARIFVA